MHQYKPIAQTLLVLSIFNLVFASSVVLREALDTGNDVVVVAGDVTTVSLRRRGTLPPEAPGSASVHSSDPSSGSTSSSHLLATDGQMPVQDWTTEKTPTIAHPLSAAHGAAPVPDSTTEASTSAHPLSAANTPAPVPDSITQASTSSHQPVPVHGSAAEGRPPSGYSVVTYDMLTKDKKFYEKTAVRRIAGLTLFGGAILALVLYSTLHKSKNP